MGKIMSKGSAIRFLRGAARRALLLGLMLAVLAALLGTSAAGAGIIGSSGVAKADSTGHRSSTHVVVKLKSGASIDWLVHRISTWRYGSGPGEGYFRVEREKSFPGTGIHVLRVTSGSATALANRLPAQKAQVAWAEPGIFTPIAEASRFSPAAYERFNQAAFEKFSQAAYERFSQAAYERFAHAAYERFSPAAYERFSQAAFDRFAQAAFETFSQAVFERFSQVAYEKFSQAAYERFRQAVYEQFSAAVYERFRQTAYEGLSEEDYQAILGVVADLLEDEAFEAAFRQLIEEMVAAYQLEYRTRFEGQPAVAQIRAREAQAIARGGGVTVAVVDTGISVRHWYLADAIAPGGLDLIDGGDAEDTGDGVDNNRNGHVDEGVGHGTFIAGLVRLVAPDAKLLPIRAIDDEGAGWSFVVAEGIYRAVDAGAHVINLSLSIPERSMVIQEALAYADRQGVLVVAAAGNHGEKLTLYPAAFDSVIGVAAVDSSNLKADFSNYGNNTVAVAAPGVDLYGPYPAGVGFATWSGTSFSTALVAGQAALVYPSNAGGKDVDRKVRRTILGTSLSLEAYDPVHGDHLGKGLIDVAAALARGTHED